MKPSAIKKAKRRFRHATDSMPYLTLLQKGAAEDDFEQAWFEFLGTLNSIPEMLKTGCRDDPKSRQWFAAKERLIRTDPMLRYLFHARAVDFHGHDRLVKLMTTVGVPTEIDNGFDRPKQNFLNLIVPPHVKEFELWHEPQPVMDVHKNIFHPPTEFLSRRLADRSPVGMATLALAFYKDLIIEAETLSA